MLAEMLNKYLAHKLRLAQSSKHYQSREVSPALDWAYRMQQVLRSQKLSDRDIALMLRGAGVYLTKLLPFPANKSYRSSRENLDKIITCCREMLQPKNSDK